MVAVGRCNFRNATTIVGLLLIPIVLCQPSSTEIETTSRHIRGTRSMPVRKPPFVQVVSTSNDEGDGLSPLADVVVKMTMKIVAGLTDDEREELFHLLGEKIETAKTTLEYKMKNPLVDSSIDGKKKGHDLEPIVKSIEHVAQAAFRDMTDEERKTQLDILASKLAAAKLKHAPLRKTVRKSSSSVEEVVQLLRGAFVDATEGMPPREKARLLELLAAKIGAAQTHGGVRVVKTKSRFEVSEVVDAVKHLTSKLMNELELDAQTALLMQLQKKVEETKNGTAADDEEESAYPKVDVMVDAIVQFTKKAAKNMTTAEKREIINALAGNVTEAQLSLAAATAPTTQVSVDVPEKEFGAIGGLPDDKKLELLNLLSTKVENAKEDLDFGEDGPRTLGKVYERTVAELPAEDKLELLNLLSVRIENAKEDLNMLAEIDHDEEDILDEALDGFSVEELQGLVAVSEAA